MKHYKSVEFCHESQAALLKTVWRQFCTDPAKNCEHMVCFAINVWVWGLTGSVSRWKLPCLAWLVRGFGGAINDFSFGLQLQDQAFHAVRMPAVANVCVLGLRMREKIVGNCFFDAFVLLGIDD